MITRNSLLLFLLLQLLWPGGLMGQTLYIDSEQGADSNDGGSPNRAKRSLSSVQSVTWTPGARILLKAGTVIKGELLLEGVKGTAEQPITISSYWEGVPAHFQPALIDAAGCLSAIRLDDCSYVNVTKLRMTANGGGFNRADEQAEAMRVGLLVRARSSVVEQIHASELELFDLFFENPGYVRDPKETHTANGTQGYGYGIRMISALPQTSIKDVSVKQCHISRMSHTGIKLSGNSQNISNVELLGNTIYAVGGPGMQLSQTKNCYVAGNTVNRSGSPDDSRSWKRGSGMWMYGSDGFLIEHNRFTNANGTNDSAGAHIDCNNKNIVLQYNFSANNAGGFVEILGNSWNCCYRYNVSVNDGWRVAKQPVGGGLKASNSGEIIWLSGYMGKAPHSGPYFSYIYNNTIYVDNSMAAGYFFQKSVTGVLIANNIFNIVGESISNSKLPGKIDAGDVLIRNNLFCRKENWPSEEKITDAKPLYGEAKFRNPGGLSVVDYFPTNRKLIKGKGIRIEALPNDTVGVKIGFGVEKDILGNAIGKQIDLGAIAIQ